MGFEGKKGKFEIEISAAVRACERSRGRMIEGISFLEESRYVWCWLLVFGCHVCLFCRQMSWLR